MGTAVSLRQDERERSPTTNRRLVSCLVLKFTANYIGFGCLNLRVTLPRLDPKHGYHYDQARSESPRRAVLRVRRCSLSG